MSDRRSGSFEVFGGSFWFIGWLFTIGYAGLSFWEGALALIAWPYFLGVTLGDIPEPSQSCNKPHNYGLQQTLAFGSRC